MYLNKLKSDLKEIFLDLCIYAVNSDSCFEKQEKNMLDAYCDEMHISPRYEAIKSFDEVLDVITSSISDTEKHIILLEISALILSDGSYDCGEQQFMKQLTESLNINNIELEYVITMLNKLTDVYKEIDEYIS